MRIKKLNRPTYSRFRKKRRSCFLTKNRVAYVDYKDVELLQRFLSKSGQILPRFITGTKTAYQRQIAIAVKRARFLGLLAFTASLDSEK